MFGGWDRTEMGYDVLIRNKLYYIFIIILLRITVNYYITHCFKKNSLFFGSVEIFVKVFFFFFVCLIFFFFNYY